MESETRSRRNINGGNRKRREGGEVTESGI